MSSAEERKCDHQGCHQKNWELVEDLRKKYVQIKEAEKTYTRWLTFTEEARVARHPEEARVAKKNIRSLIEGELIKRAILAASKQKKRSRSSSAIRA